MNDVNLLPRAFKLPTDHQTPRSGSEAAQKWPPDLFLQICKTAPRPLPQKRAHSRRQRKKDTKRNTQTPNTLYLITRQTIRPSPNKIIHLPHIRANTGQERFRAAPVFGEDRAVEIGERLADGDGDDDDGDEEGGVETGGNEEGEVAVPEKNVGDGAVEDCYAGLGCVRNATTGRERQEGGGGLTTLRVPMRTLGGLVLEETI